MAQAGEKEVTQDDLLKAVGKAKKRNTIKLGTTASGKAPSKPCGKKKVKNRVVKSGKLPAQQDNSQMEIQNKAFNDNTEIIIQLYKDVQLALRTTLEQAIAIGQLLIEQKEVVPSGEFGIWIDKTLPFTHRTGTRYMQLYYYRKTLAKEGIVTITKAYHRIFALPIPDEANADDNPVGDAPCTIVEAPDVENLKPPKHRSKGHQTHVTLDNNTVDKFINGTYFIGDKKGLCSKIIIEIHPYSTFHRVDEFLRAAAKYLRPGGYIKFLKAKV